MRPGLTVTLARYFPPDDGSPLHLVARTPPAWASAGQRISLALWDPASPLAGAGGHPHPRPDQRFRLDLHRHLWDARRTGEPQERSGAARWSTGDDPGLRDGHAAHRWAAEAALVLEAEGRVRPRPASPTARARPDVVVALTDGQTPWPETRPACRTVVGLFPRERRSGEDDPGYVPDAPPEWARVVTIGRPFSKLFR